MEDGEYSDVGSRMSFEQANLLVVCKKNAPPHMQGREQSAVGCPGGLGQPRRPGGQRYNLLSQTD